MNPEERLLEAEALLESNDTSAAKAAFSDVVAMIEMRSGPSAPALVKPLWRLASLNSMHKYEPSSEVEQSLVLLRRAVAISDASAETDCRQFASVLATYATLLWIQGCAEDAFVSVRRARELTAGLGGDVRWHVGMMAEILLLSLGRPKEALVYARELVELESRNGGEIGATSHARFLLADCLRRVGPPVEARAYLKAFLARTSEWGTNDDELKVIVRGWLEGLGRDSEAQ